MQPDSHACRASAVSDSLRSFPSNGTLLPEDSMSASFPAGVRFLVPGVAPAWSDVRPDGLPTPPADMTSLAYSNGAAPDSSSTAEGSAGKQYALHPNAQQQVPCPPLASSNAMSYDAYCSSRQNAPARAQPTKAGSQTKDAPRDSVAPYLQIPPTIRTSSDNLAELAAQVGELQLRRSLPHVTNGRGHFVQIACLFWFEGMQKLKAIEDGLAIAYSLAPEAVPTADFQKWVTSILSTTQVSQNVVLLALLFIYRLKKFNPTVRGKKGSEYRLMTIALMMGNKCTLFQFDSRWLSLGR